MRLKLSLPDGLGGNCHIRQILQGLVSGAYAEPSHSKGLQNMKIPMRAVLLCALVSSILSGCASAPLDDAVHNTAGLEVSTVPLDRQGPISGVGISAQDIVAMSDQLVRSMLANPTLTRSDVPPQVIVDDQYFANESSQTINKKLITNRLRVALNKAANGRMVFVARHNADMVESERQLKRDGVVDIGTTGLARAVAGGDFRLSGTFATLDARSPSTGTIQRYNQVVLEMVDLERGVIVWSDSYEVERAGRENIVYR